MRIVIGTRTGAIVVFYSKRDMAGPCRREFGSSSLPFRLLLPLSALSPAVIFPDVSAWNPESPRLITAHRQGFLFSDRLQFRYLSGIDSRSEVCL